MQNFYISINELFFLTVWMYNTINSFNHLPVDGPFRVFCNYQNERASGI